MTAQARIRALPDLLRPITAEDIEPLADLWYEGWRIGHASIVPEALLRHRGRDSFRDRIVASMGDCLVLGDQSALQGFVRIKGHELDQFYVAPDRIGKGVARHLMDQAQDAMRARGVGRAFLIASVGNDRAIRFYERLGWHNCGRFQAGVETAEGPFTMDVIRFEKSL